MVEKTLFRPEYRILLGIIRQARIEAGVTQEALASNLDVPRTTIVKWETGQQRMDLLEFWTLCEELGADPLELLARFRDAWKAAQ
jgi:DNA-binding XRE family transcriptional regulator